MTTMMMETTTTPLITTAAATTTAVAAAPEAYRRKPLEKLVGALLLDKVFREGFMCNASQRPLAVQYYNQTYFRRFGEPLAALNTAEETLIMSLPTTSLQEFCQVLEAILVEAEEKPRKVAIAAAAASTRSLRETRVRDESAA